MRIGIIRHDAINESDSMTFQCVPGAEMVGTKPLPHAKLPVRVYRDGGNQPYGLGDFEWWREYDVLDVPDFIYPWSIQVAEVHENVWLTVWDNLPWNAQGEHVRRLHARVRGYICRSKQAVNMVRYLVGDGKPIHLVPAGVDVELFSSASQHSHCFQVLYVGRLSWEKGLLEMVHATRNLAREFEAGAEPIHFQAVGGGEWLNWLREAGVDCPGYVEHHLLPDVYRQASLFLYPSVPAMNWQEQFGISVIEAMASGLPVIVSDSGALPDLLPPGMRRDLCVVPAGRWDLLRERIRWFMENPAQARTIGLMNREWAVRIYASEVVGKQLEAIYGP